MSTDREDIRNSFGVNDDVISLMELFGALAGVVAIVALQAVGLWSVSMWGESMRAKQKEQVRVDVQRLEGNEVIVQINSSE